MSLRQVMGRGCSVIRSMKKLHAADSIIPRQVYRSLHVYRQKSWLHTASSLFQSTNSGEGAAERQVWHIDHTTMADGVKKCAINVLDVRTPEEFKSLGNIPTSHNLPVEEIENALELSEEHFQKQYKFPKPSPKGPTIVAYCRSGKRSQRACEILLKFKYNNIGNYIGSWNEWSDNHPEDVLKPDAGRK